MYQLDANNFTMIFSHSKIVCIKLVQLPYLYIWCTVTLTSNYIHTFTYSVCFLDFSQLCTLH